MENSVKEMSLEQYFKPFRENIIDEEYVHGPQGKKKIIYADWTASGRLYRPIEERIINDMGGFVANTHTETSYTGKLMTQAYHEAKAVIKKHVNCDENDALIPCGTGMTGAVLKFQRILGLKYPEKIDKYLEIPERDRPVVFISHMEHHSNQTSWLETIAKVECIKGKDNCDVDLDHLRELLEIHKDNPFKIASITGCSNVTGIETPYHEIAEIMHEHGGYCFVDFACSGPYVKIDMHPSNPKQKLDAIFFSPHKFLGGPGTPGILIFCSELYTNKIPDQPGGGTVTWTNPWGEHHYFDDIETREDGGTPGFLQTIKAALAVKLKEEMGVDQMIEREHELLDIIFPRLEKVEGLHLLAGDCKNRMGVVSFYVDGLHYNLGVRLLNDYFGVQTRGGCSCAGTYGHYLLEVSPQLSKSITDEINHGDLSHKPGWIRMSIHPTMTNEEVETIVTAIEAVAGNFKEWSKEYIYSNKTNEYTHKSDSHEMEDTVLGWFENSLK